jgi:urea transporter/murein DD-endopeptidase MepM/ murein hydrolase activator NlpD
MKDHFRAIFNSYPEVFFLQNRLLGVVFFALLLIHPNVGLAGLISVLAAYAFARMIGLDRKFLESGYYTYNPLLVGLAMGSLFKITWLSVLFMMSAGVLTLIVALVMSSIFMTHFRLPILSLPFVIVSTIASLASLRYSNLPFQPHPEWDLLHLDSILPFWIAGFFKSFGAVLFSPDALVGMFFALLVLSASRILFLLAVLGFFVGAGMRSLMLGSMDQAFTDVTNFNAILIAMSVGGVFLVPSPRGYLLAIVSVVVSTLLLDALAVLAAEHGLQVLTLPFNMTCLGTVFVLGLVKHPMVPIRIGRTPEETLEDHLANRLRYPGGVRTLFLPFSGRWSVWQGFDGKWTHKGNWRHAYDFVITDDQGKTHGGDGSKLEDYYCFNKPVLCPVRGRVVRVVDDLADSPIGDPDRANNWGNFVIIEDPRGFCVEISHLAAKSIGVHKGDWLERGAVLGMCGNSGYSPQPHIHVQVQATDYVGDASLPFSFVSYGDAGSYIANELPREKAQVEPLYPDKRLDSVTNFVLDETQNFEVWHRQHQVGQLDVKVQMALDGTFYLESDRGFLYFGKHEGTFYFYRIEGNDPWLKLLFLALPRLPMAYREKLAWRDYVPAGLILPGPKRVAARFLSSFVPALAKVETAQTFAASDRITSVIRARTWGLQVATEMQLHATKGFARVQVGDWELRRIDEKVDTTSERGAE